MKPAFPGPPRARRGMPLVGVILVIFCLGAAALFLHRLSSQAGRASHWFVQAQQAHDLADAGLRAAVEAMDQGSSPAKAGLLPGIGPALEPIVAQLVAGGGAGTFPLLDSKGTLPAGLKSLIDALADWSPQLSVEVTVAAGTALAGPAGLPTDPREVAGKLRLTARGSVDGATSGRIERSIVMERAYKVVCVVPPLVTRFVLFAAGRQGQELDFVEMEVDPATGAGKRVSPAPPLRIEAGDPVSLVPEEGRLDRAPIAPLAGAAALDKPGWIYLGGSEAWKLGLAYGLGEDGEGFLLPGDRRRVEYLGDAGQDQGFRDRFTAQTRTVGQCVAEFTDPEDGLYQFHHGMANNYEVLGVDASVPGAAGGKKPDLGPAKASCLRLLGTPAKASPTLVFGPVEREYIRRAAVRATLGPPGGCRRPGGILMHLLRLEEHDPRVAGVLEKAFEAPTGWEQAGTGRVVEPYVQSLGPLLDPRGKGRVGPGGILVPDAPVTGPGPAFGSALLSGLGSIPGADGVPQAARDFLWKAELASPDLLTGSLAAGLGLLKEGLAAKASYQVPLAALPRRIHPGGRLSIPGIVLVDAPGPVPLPAITAVDEGGILMAPKGFELAGDLLRGPGREPVTLVALDGDIVLGSGVKKVEGFLVALTGRVRLPPGPFELRGGIAGATLDLDSVRDRPAERVLAYTKDMDWTDPAVRTKALRVYYGNEVQMAFGGSVPAP